MTSHMWIAVYVLAPIAALVVIAICSRLRMKWLEARAAEQAQYHEAKAAAESGLFRAHTLLEAFDALCEHVRTVDDADERERLVLRFVYDEHARWEQAEHERLLASIAAMTAADFESLQHPLQFEDATPDAQRGRGSPGDIPE